MYSPAAGGRNTALRRGNINMNKGGERNIMKYRTEHDSMGEIRVPADRLWGAQTQRSVENFPIGAGIEAMPGEIIRAFGLLKQAAAMANRALLPEKMTEEKLWEMFEALR